MFAKKDFMKIVSFGDWYANIKLKNNLLYVFERLVDPIISAYDQTVLRYKLIQNLFQIDTTSGRKFNTNSGWLSFSFVATPD